MQKEQEIHCDMFRRILLFTILDQKSWRKVFSKHSCRERVDLQHFCNCEDKIRSMRVYHSYDDYYQDISWFEFLMKEEVLQA